MTARLGLVASACPQSAQLSRPTVSQIIMILQDRFMKIIGQYLRSGVAFGVAREGHPEPALRFEELRRVQRRSGGALTSPRADGT